jgi:hypothetical protein
MATITKTVARLQDDAGIRRRIIAEYTGPVLYAAGGDAIAAGDVNLGTIEFFNIEPLVNATPVILIAKYNYSTGKLQIFDMAGAESGAVDLSGYTARFEAIGK